MGSARVRHYASRERLDSSKAHTFLRSLCSTYYERHRLPRSRSRPLRYRRRHSPYDALIFRGDRIARSDSCGSQTVFTRLASTRVSQVRLSLNSGAQGDVFQEIGTRLRWLVHALPATTSWHRAHCVAGRTRRSEQRHPSGRE